MANAFALWSTSVLVTKLLSIYRCGQIVNSYDSDIRFSQFLKNFEVLEFTVLTPLNQVFFEQYETKWMKETMHQTEHNQENDEDEEYLNDNDEKSKSKNTYEYTQWEELMTKIKPHSAEPIDPFHHFARLLIVINSYMYQALNTTVLGRKTLVKIEVWIGYMNEIIRGRKHHVMEHFNSTLYNDFSRGLQHLTRLVSTYNQQHTGDEYSFFSPGVLLLRALSSTYTGQERTDFRHCKSQIWSKQSSLMIWDIILREKIPTRLITANEQPRFKCPFIGDLPIQLCINDEVVGDERYELENLFEATLNWFERMTVRCFSKMETSVRSCNVLAERNIVVHDILGCGGIISRTCENTSLRKERNNIKAKTSKSEIKKADKSRSRAYRPKFPLNALKKNYYIFGEEILNTLLPKVPNYKHISSGQKRKCSVSPIEDELPDECL